MYSFKSSDYINYQQDHFKSRWLTQSQWLNFIHQLEPCKDFNSRVIGSTYQKRDLTAWYWGKGDIRVLIWSQMHGNEPTGTMALADLFTFLNSKNDGYDQFRDHLKAHLCLCVVPILNPDGAEVFTRENAQGIDINRDARRLSTSEMQAFMKLKEDFDPHYAFNLHDQRSIFSAGNSNNPATISLLAASSDASRQVNRTRKEAMRIIVAINNSIQQEIVGCVGRYSDEFYPRALGDHFHKVGIPCVLIESGASRNDDLRSVARKMNFLALIEAFKAIIEKDEPENILLHYEEIPENEKLFYDILLRDVAVESGLRVDLALHADETIDSPNSKLIKLFKIKEIGDLGDSFGLIEFEGVRIESEKDIGLDQVADFTVWEGERLRISFKEGILHEEH